jgi:hypothetical protein
MQIYTQLSYHFQNFFVASKASLEDLYPPLYLLFFSWHIIFIKLRYMLFRINASESNTAFLKMVSNPCQATSFFLWYNTPSVTSSNLGCLFYHSLCIHRCMDHRNLTDAKFLSVQVFSALTKKALFILYTVSHGYNL